MWSNRLALLLASCRTGDQGTEDDLLYQRPAGEPFRLEAVAEPLAEGVNKIHSE